MTIPPQPAKYHPESAILSLGENIGDPVQAADFPQTILRFRNDRWAEAVGLGGLSDDAWTQHFGRFRPLEDSLQQPLALVVGAEAAGVPKELLAAAAARVRIPLRPPVESLNVAVAAGVLLFEAQRQRSR